MRWLVEVTSIDKTDTQSVVVDAESWQRALQGARAQRGESGPISGFSIELLDEGYRAVDPMARLRYVVKRAADDAKVTAAAPAGGAGASVAPAPARAAAPAPAPAAQPAAPPAAVPAPAPAAATAATAATVGGSVAPPRPGGPR